jgi:hypothetical protein
MIDLHVVLKTISMQEFVGEAPAYSIALDGYVRGGPQFSPNGPHINYNHHEDVDRLATRSTCAQVLMSLRQGLFSRFRDTDGPRAHVYVNDCDEDVCTSWTLLRHHYLAEGVMNPLLNRLVAMEDALDCTAGAYPYPKDLPALQELAWVFEPYRQFRLGGQLDRKDPTAYRSVICDVEHRILQHIAGRGRTVPLDTRYQRIGGGDGWAMVEEVGAQARTGMFADGIRTFVSVRVRPDGKTAYVIGKMDPFSRLDLVALAAKLNELEGNPDDLWGGGSTIIGSPRRLGSTLPPASIQALLGQAVS